MSAESGDVYKIEATNLVKADRIDKWISNSNLPFSRSQIQRLLENNRVYVNGSRCKKNYKVKNKDLVEIYPFSKVKDELLPSEGEINIVFEDEHCAVIDKEYGLCVHPRDDDEGTSTTLANILLYRYGKDGLSSIGGINRPGIVHRLDKDTSGLIVICKHDIFHEKMKALFFDHTKIVKEYEVVVYGKLNEAKGSINSRIMRHPGKNKGTKMATTHDPSLGKDAHTEYERLDSFTIDNVVYSLVKVRIFTGRTHQIRVHMASIGHPVVGDPLYYTNRKLAVYKGGLLLQSRHLEFIHPMTNELMSFSIERMERTLQFCKMVT